MSAVADVIDARLAAYRARNLEAFLACYAADVLIGDGDGNVVVRGRENMREGWAFLATSPNLLLEIPQRIEVGNVVIDEELIDGIVVEEVEQPQQHVVTIYRVTDSLISNVTFLR